MTQEEYKEASEFWINIDAKSEKAPKELVRKTVEEFIAAHNTCALATGFGDFIRCTPIEYTWHDDTFLLFSEGGLKFKALAKNNNVGIAIFDQFTTWSAIHGMQVTGKAEIIDENSDLYEQLLETKHLSREKLAKLGHPMHIIKVVPERIDILMSELKKQGFASRQMLEF